MIHNPMNSISASGTVISATILIILIIVITTNQLNRISAQIVSTPLTQEQINEVERDPGRIVEKCSTRIDLKMDAGKLCNSLLNYLEDKCKRLDNLPDYCTGLSAYKNKRSIQQSCILNPPKTTEGIENCRNYLNSNSTFSVNLSKIEMISPD